MPLQLFGCGRRDWSTKLTRGLNTEAATGFQSRRGSRRDPTTVTHQHAPFATYKAEADRLFSVLGEGGQVQMPIGKTFFSPRFGMVADRFGVSWMIVTTPAS